MSTIDPTGVFAPITREAEAARANRYTLAVFLRLALVAWLIGCGAGLFAGLLHWLAGGA